MAMHTQAEGNTLGGPVYTGGGENQGGKFIEGDGNRSSTAN